MPQKIIVEQHVTIVRPSIILDKTCECLPEGLHQELSLCLHSLAGGIAFYSAFS